MTTLGQESTTMGNPSIKRRRRDHGGSGEKRQRPHGNYDENWLARMVRGLYRSTMDEPVSQDMLDIMTRLAQANPPVTRPSPEPSKPDQPSGAPAHEAWERACRWHAKAEECRTAAESMVAEAARSSLLQLARNYQVLAELAEKEAHQRGDKEQGAG